MGCCIALALLISLARRAWFKVVPGSARAPVLFAPLAWRPAPGESGALPDAPARARRHSLRAIAGVAMIGAGLAWCGLTVLGAVVPVIGHSGVCPCACCPTGSGSLFREALLHAPGLLATAAGSLLLIAARLRPAATTA
jgi:hypothetical protein